MIGIVLLIWLYTRRSGIRTIVWTDSLQTLCLLLALGLILYEVSGQLDLDFRDWYMPSGKMSTAVSLF